MDNIIKIFIIIITTIINQKYFTNYNISIPIVTNNDGLYQTSTTTYTYKGKNPNNYLYFNDELWRIISYEDKNIKIIKNQSIGKMAFDKNDSNQWASSSLHQYLNNEYYNQIKEKTLIAKHTFKINDNQTWYGAIGVISINDYLQANSNKALCGHLNLYFKNEEKCFQTNYINHITERPMWTITPEEDALTTFYVTNTFFPDIMPSDENINVYPVVYLQPNITLIGQGTLQNPYKIKTYQK